MADLLHARQSETERMDSFYGFLADISAYHHSEQPTQDTQLLQFHDPELLNLNLSPFPYEDSEQTGPEPV